MGTITPTQRVTEAAQDMNTAVRFGRMDVAIERVDTPNRAQFLGQRASWGNAVRIMDCDVVGVELPERERANIRVSVSWQRLTESDMRTTTVTQHWRDRRGRWVLTGEDRASGDDGLFNQSGPPALDTPSEPPAHFPTKTIR